MQNTWLVAELIGLLLLADSEQSRCLVHTTSVGNDYNEERCRAQLPV